jgi:hypothetical protein
MEEPQIPMSVFNQLLLQLQRVESLNELILLTLQSLVGEIRAREIK